MKSIKARVINELNKIKGQSEIVDSWIEYVIKNIQDPEEIEAELSRCNGDYIWWWWLDSLGPNRYESSSPENGEERFWEIMDLYTIYIDDYLGDFKC